MAKSKSPAPSERTLSLQRFSLEDLAPFTREGTFAKSASRDFRLFYVGRDDLHGICGPYGGGVFVPCTSAPSLKWTVNAPFSKSIESPGCSRTEKVMPRMGTR